MHKRSESSKIKLMVRAISFSLFFTVLSARLPADQPPEDGKPVRTITAGKVIVPTEKMRRIWGELVSVDLESRTGTFRAESEDKIYKFSVTPYAELLHHATNGDLSDFRIGERAIFRLHVNEAGEWYWLTYIQDEMNMLNGHQEYYFVKSIDVDQGRIGFTWAKGDMTFIRQEGLFLETNSETRYWKNGQPAKFSDIQVGDKLRAKTHGIGKGNTRVCWEVFLDDASLLKFREEQIAVHSARLTMDGAPGYVDRIAGKELDLTMFQSGLGIVGSLKPGSKVRVAPTGTNLKAVGDGVSGSVVRIDPSGNVRSLTLKLTTTAEIFEVAGVSRIWLEK